MRQEPAEERGPLARPVRQDLRHETPVVVVEGRDRHLAEEGKGVDVTINPSLSSGRRIGPDITGIAVRQVEDEEVRLLLDAADNHNRLAEIGLGVPGRMGQRHKHLPAAPFALPHVILHDRVAAGETVLVPEPLEHPLGRMALLAMDIEIAFQPAIDDLGEPVQLRALDRCRAAVTRRHRERHDLVDGVARDVEMTRRCALAHAVGTGQPNLSIKFHGIHLQTLHAAARRAKWPVFTPPAAGLSRRYRGRVLHRRKTPSEWRADQFRCARRSNIYGLYAERTSRRHHAKP